MRSIVVVWDDGTRVTQDFPAGLVTITVPGGTEITIDVRGRTITASSIVTETAETARLDLSDGSDGQPVVATLVWPLGEDRAG